MSLKYKRKKLKIKPYRQTIGYTCGAACLLMVLHYFRPNEFPLSREIEMKIHQETYYGRYSSVHKNDLDFLGTTYPGLANFALKRGFKARLYQQYERLKYTPLWDKRTFNELRDIYEKYEREASENGLKKVVGDITCEDLILKELKSNHPTILLLPVHGRIFHNILLRGHDSTEVLYLDPGSGYRRVLLGYIEMQLNKLKFGKVALAIWR